jgi:hypothetical protein
LGSDRVLSAVLTRLRTALRIEGVQLLAGHGVADASYRPPHLPYASVVGPLAIETEAERTTPHRVVRVRNAGHLNGAARSATDVVPAPGTVELTVDGVATGTVPVDFGPVGAQPFTASAGGVPVGTLVAAALQAAIRAAVAAGVFAEDGAPVTAPARLAELAAVTARWDQANQRLVVASGRRGPLSGPPSDAPPSGVDVAPGPVAEALGLTGDGALAHPGRITRSRDVAPTAVAIDLRVDLWASSQGGLATMVDAWTAATPLRAELLLEPTPLAADVAQGDTSVRLAVGTLPRISSTVLSAGTAGSFVDRISGRPPQLAGAVVDAEGLTLGGTATATYRMIPAPPVPIAWQPHPPGARGWAAETLLRVAPGAADGAAARVLEILAGPRSVLRLDVTRDGGRYLLRGSATGTAGADLGASSVAVPRASLEAGPAPVHVLVDSAAGAVRIFAEGATPETAEEPAPGPTATTGDEDVLLRLGDPDGADLDVTVADVVVHARPVGQADPRLRSRGPVAVRWPPGTALYLGTSEDGFATRGGEFLAYVLGVDGDEVHLDRAVPQAFPRSRTVVHQGALFVSQRQLRRNDDLMNRIYRVALEYRASAFLDDVAAAVGAPLVEVPEVDVRELARLLAEEAGSPPPRSPATTRVGIGAVITTPAPAEPPAFSGLGASPSDR